MKMRWMTCLAATLLVGMFAGHVSAADHLVTVQDVVVDFAAQVDVPARQSGPVAVMSARQNQWIQAGDVVAKLDDTALVIRRRAAALKQEAARLVLSDEVEVRYAETALAEAEAELDDSVKASERVSGAVARNQIRRMRLAVERAELELARVGKQRRQAEIDIQLRAVDVASFDSELQRLQCVSPTDGVVLNIHRELGEWIREGEPLVTIADVSVLHLHALVDANQLDPARCVGLPVSVLWEKTSFSNGAKTTHSLRGKVLSVDPTRLPGNRFRLHAEVTNRRNSPSGNAGLADADGWQLVPGMDVTMNIHCSDAELAWREQRVQSGSLR
ncbi:Multidrug resistance efflux pump [Neorhodopirellula lusitana]|uniref:Multidrug resistance efflux pump n=1 Tax=Neorhodopirellula lusitana TaxID=445327 RepID=A0ABY1QP72_9BACT|nr:HlyD family efflux transporter periplasmic adaptor subunit [Neorhodopirellula lusitana]SMP76361.1 Multidrug resistance efflux pump [Neorhodopirellula lusitana]